MLSNFTVWLKLRFSSASGSAFEKSEVAHKTRVYSSRVGNYGRRRDRCKVCVKGVMCTSYYISSPIARRIHCPTAFDNNSTDVSFLVCDNWIYECYLKNLRRSYPNTLTTTLILANIAGYV